MLLSYSLQNVDFFEHYKYIWQMFPFDQGMSYNNGLISDWLIDLSIHLMSHWFNIYCTWKYAWWYTDE